MTAGVIVPPAGGGTAPPRGVLSPAALAGMPPSVVVTPAAGVMMGGCGERK